MTVPIDFGHAFGSSSFLPIPELLPFRMTPQIQALMLPFKPGSGLSREVMISGLRGVRDQSDVFLSALSTFIREPTVDWIDYAKKQSRNLGRHNQSNCSTFDAELNAGVSQASGAGFEFEIQQKIEIVKQKLKGTSHPVTIAQEELKHGQAHNSKVLKVSRKIICAFGTKLTLDDICHFRLEIYLEDPQGRFEGLT